MCLICIVEIHQLSLVTRAAFASGEQIPRAHESEEAIGCLVYFRAEQDSHLAVAVDVARRTEVLARRVVDEPVEPFRLEREVGGRTMLGCSRLRATGRWFQRALRRPRSASRAPGRYWRDM